VNDEPVITMNGRTLTQGQAMTVRVAVCNFQLELREGVLGIDDHGRHMTNAYRERLAEVAHLMLAKP
jgi:hypothetical protein